IAGPVARNTYAPAWKPRTEMLPGHSRFFDKSGSWSSSLSALLKAFASRVEADFLSRFLDNIWMATITTSPETPPNIILHQMITGSWVTQAIHVAAELGIADVLADGPRTAAEIAARVDANPDALNRILRALAGIGIFREVDDGRFGQTPISE